MRKMAAIGDVGIIAASVLESQDGAIVMQVLKISRLKSRLKSSLGSIGIIRRDVAIDKFGWRVIPPGAWT